MNVENVTKSALVCGDCKSILRISHKCPQRKFWHFFSHDVMQTQCVSDEVSKQYWHQRRRISDALEDTLKELDAVKKELLLLKNANV